MLGKSGPGEYWRWALAVAVRERARFAAGREADEELRAARWERELEWRQRLTSPSSSPAAQQVERLAGGLVEDGVGRVRISSSSPTGRGNAGGRAFAEPEWLVDAVRVAWPVELWVGGL